jgi:hypothetical protein
MSEAILAATWSAEAWLSLSVRENEILDKAAQVHRCGAKDILISSPDYAERWSWVREHEPPRPAR